MPQRPTALARIGELNEVGSLRRVFLFKSIFTDLYLGCHKTRELRMTDLGWVYGGPILGMNAWTDAERGERWDMWHRKFMLAWHID